MLLWNLTHPTIEYKEKIVTKVQERVRTLTKTVVSPDGTKETITETVSSKDTDVTQESTKLSKKPWTVFVTATTNDFPNLTPVYGVGFTKEIILGINAGAYVNTEKELGLAFSYSF